MWPTSFALTKLTAAEEARIGALVKKAVSWTELATGPRRFCAAPKRMTGSVWRGRLRGLAKKGKGSPR
jgi:hypothetical protein